MGRIWCLANASRGPWDSIAIAENARGWGYPIDVCYVEISEGDSDDDDIVMVLKDESMILKEESDESKS